MHAFTAFLRNGHLIHSESVSSGSLALCAARRETGTAPHPPKLGAKNAMIALRMAPIARRFARCSHFVLYVIAHRAAVHRHYIRAMRGAEIAPASGAGDVALQTPGLLRVHLQTDKNLALIRLVLTPGVWSRVVDLPEQLLQQARLQRRHAPVRAAVLAQIAAAVAILTVAPVRLGNLSSIRLGENLIKPGGPYCNFWLTFPKYDVKNRTPLQFKLDETVTAIINEYVHDFRPALMRGSNADWLFPGEAGNHKEKISFSTQIVERVQKSTGLRITVHQFRHAAGALILKHRPGEYELVRRVLGHKSAQTTKNFYLSLETTQASEIFTEIVRLHRPRCKAGFHLKPRIVGKEIVAQRDS